MSKKILYDLGIKGYKVYGRQDLFLFGTDSVLLSDFVKVKKNERVIDLGTGTGILPILLAAKTEGKVFYGIDIVEDAVSLANESVRYNKIEDRIKIEKVDIKEVDKYYKEIFDVVVTNPPYMIKSRNSKNEKMQCVNKNTNLEIARHEVLCTIEDVVKAGSKLLGTKGRFYIVYKPDRLTSLLFFMRKYNIEPKEIQFVHPFPNKEANMVLVEGVKDGKEGVKILPSKNICEV